ncbi:hypothetical protein GF351_05510 [Candidatus Woesearchaeota archaeon]|nr:hypothetical protein [Candidatus Woesearchaeota archaeon]
MIHFRPIDAEFIFMLAAVIVFFVYSYALLRRKKLAGKRDAAMYLLVVITFAVIGARIWGFADRPDIFSRQFFLDFVNPMHADMQSMGVIAGVFAGVLISTFVFRPKKAHYQYELARFFDVLVVPGALALFIARLGCLLDGHILGKPSALPWAIQYPGEAFGRHPAAAYLSLSALLIFAVLKFFFDHKKTSKTRLGKRFDGEIAVWFVSIYCFNRFWIEFFVQGHHGGTDPRYLGLLGVQWVCLVTSVLFLFHLMPMYILYKFEKRKAFGYPPLSLIKYLSRKDQAD